MQDVDGVDARARRERDTVFEFRGLVVDVDARRCDAIAGSVVIDNVDIATHPRTIVDVQFVIAGAATADLDPSQETAGRHRGRAEREGVVSAAESGEVEEGTGDSRQQVDDSAVRRIPIQVTGETGVSGSKAIMAQVSTAADIDDERVATSIAGDARRGPSQRAREGEQPPIFERLEVQS